MIFSIYTPWVAVRTLYVELLHKSECGVSINLLYSGLTSSAGSRRSLPWKRHQW